MKPMASGTFLCVYLLVVSELGPSTSLLSYLTECQDKVYPLQKNGAWCNLRNGVWSKAPVKLNCGVITTQVLLVILTRRYSASMEEKNIIAKIAGVAAFACTKGTSAHARNA
jgi:hypothetical protein